MFAPQQIIKKDLLDDHDDNEPDHFYARAYVNLPGDAVGSVYGVYQMGRKSNDDDLLWLGGSVIGSTYNDIDYWAEFAHVSGYGFDPGLTKTFKQAGLNPRLTAGIAFGSGDNGAGTDTAFRQTDIQDNSGRFGSKTGLKYYGEVFDPELSNLTILTLGAGSDVMQESSLDPIYHYSFQNRKADKIRDSKLDHDPTGDIRSLGQEIDIVLGHREFEKVDIDLVAGVSFFPARPLPQGVTRPTFWPWRCALISDPRNQTAPDPSPLAILPAVGLFSGR